MGMLRTLKSLQGEDGSFSSVRSSEGEEEDDDDDSDLRFSYAAAAIRYLLLARDDDDDDDGPTTSSTSGGGWEGEEEDDIDVKSAVSYVLSCRSYDGALGLTPGREGHGGSTFCGIAALRLLGAPLGDDVAGGGTTLGSSGWGEDLVRWCASRQFRLPPEKTTTRWRGEDGDRGDENEDGGGGGGGGSGDDCGRSPWRGRAAAAGMQGRPNKPEDTCYSYWIGGTMHLLGMSHLLDGTSLREYVLSCQTMFGGFGKVSGAMPDLLHSFYSLAWLSLSNERGVCCRDDEGGGDDDGRGDEDGGRRRHRDHRDNEVEGSIGRLSELDCAMGMCSKRVRRAILTNGERVGKGGRYSPGRFGTHPLTDRDQ
jgi:geranylgeranyl transferase type-1 subunit beta